ncbi:UNVERIFIED_CONTAM: hypothetical protein K2H54_040829 [Gekko kuhli]
MDSGSDLDPQQHFNTLELGGPVLNASRTLSASSQSSHKSLTTSLADTASTTTKVLTEAPSLQRTPNVTQDLVQRPSQPATVQMAVAGGHNRGQQLHGVCLQRDGNKLANIVVGGESRWCLVAEARSYTELTSVRGMGGNGPIASERRRNRGGPGSRGQEQCEPC